MRINRNNYEMFFLLYVDKELSAQEQREVEAFIAVNPDLASELDALMKTKLYSPVHIMFNDKTSLYKTVATQIDETNYEDYFLQYIDKELNAEQKAAVENFIGTHPQYAQELAVLQQTVLPQEHVSFVNKQSLYRTEKPEKRVVPFRFARLAIAATLIGVTAMVWWLIPSGNNTTTVAVVKQPAVKTQKIPQTKTPVVKQTDEVAVAQQKTSDEKKLMAKTIVEKNDGTKTLTVKNKNPLKKEARIINAKQDIAQPVIIAQHKDEQLQTESSPVTTNVIAANTNNIKNDMLKPLVETNIEKTKAAEAAYAVNEKISLVQPAVYKELDTDEDDTQTLYVGGMQLNKDKVKGFLKKAGKLFGGKSKAETTEENTPLP